MKRHSDPEALLRKRRDTNLKWAGRVGDRVSQARETTNQSCNPETSITEGASPHDSDASWNLEKGGMSPFLRGGRGERNAPDVTSGRVVPVGEHHEGSFGVYMAHKINKLRQQTDGTVTRHEGEEGRLFAGVFAHINGNTKLPVATIRELLMSRGGVVEAYNTSRCTHMICESLPYAKTRELRKLRHPPAVVRSDWISDSVRAGRKLPTASYMVEGVFVQKSTLAASFAASGGRPSSRSTGDGGGTSASTAKRKALPVAVGDNGSSVQPRQSHSQFVSLSHSKPAENPGPVSARGVAVVESARPGGLGVSSGAPSRSTGGSGVSQDNPGGFSDCMEMSDDDGTFCPSEASANSADRFGATPSLYSLPGVEPAASTKYPPDTHGTQSSSSSPRLAQSEAMGEKSRPTSVTKSASPTTDFGDEDLSPASHHDRSGLGAPLPWLELPGMGDAGERGRSTLNDPTFMETFFKASRLHFIGVGRAHAIKVVNAGLAARRQPGAPQPIYGGPMGREESRVILHVDMDCFFVSVLLRNRPELRDKPVAVAHNASNAKGAGSSEVSSCNYPARAKGVGAGMFMMKAKELCPELVVLRYDFEAYREASDKMYGVFLRYAPTVMAVSCDEAYLELAEGTDAMAAAAEIRREIMKETGCPASAGASSNMLLARMATKKAKPDGQAWLPPVVAMHHMGPLPVEDLPGVGWKLRRKLNEKGIKVCSDLWLLSLAHLQKTLGLGEKTGQSLWEACRGMDKRPVQAPPERKSIGAEVNYGIRFDTQAQVNGFMSKLAVELSERMRAEGVVGRTLTIKLKKQRDGVGPPRKYLGHGICDARSKLVNFRGATCDPETLKTIAIQLLLESKIPPDKLRGIGLSMSRLDPMGAGDSGGVDGSSTAAGSSQAGALHSWLRRAEDARVKEINPVMPTVRSGSEAVIDSRPKERTQTSFLSLMQGSSSCSVESRSSIPSESLGACVARTSGPASRAMEEEKRTHELSKSDDGGSAEDNTEPPGSHPRADPTAGTPGDERPSQDAWRVPEVEEEEEEEEELEGVFSRVSSSTHAAEGSRAATAEDKLHAGGSSERAESTTGVSALRGRARALHPSPATRQQTEASSSSSGAMLSPAGRVRPPPSTPTSGRKCSPSMSQITFSQVDSSVLNALPSDLRREVLLQLEARHQQREAEKRSRLSDTSPNSGRRLQASPTRLHEDRVGDPASPESDRKGLRRHPATGISSTREGFDVAVSERLEKAQQVSLDSLWTLRKLRDCDTEAPDAEQANLDKDFLRAMPLGLGLQYATMTDAQRAQIARQYAQRADYNDCGSANDVREVDIRDAETKRLPEDVGSRKRTRHEHEGLRHFPAESRSCEDLEEPSSALRGLRSPGVAADGTASSHEHVASSELQHVSLSQVDREVLDCLPPEVRDEVLRAIGSNRARVPSDGGEAGDQTPSGAARMDVDEHEEHTKELNVTAQPNFVDVTSPPSRTPSPQLETSRKEQERALITQREGTRVFQIEDSRTLRRALRSWIGEAVLSPSQWHLELLYRYLKELVEDGRLDLTATMLRCIGRLASKANREWLQGYAALLEAVQELVRRRRGGLSLSLVF